MAKVALLIGVSEYQPGLNPLPGAIRDVDAVREVLIHPQIGEFPESNVTLLKNPERQEMELAIETLFSGRHKDDLVLLYFSGHGVKDDRGRLFLSTRTTRKTIQGELIRATAVAASFVHDRMGESRSKRQIVILDSCFSGAFAEGLSARDDGSVDIRQQLGGEGRVVLTSSSSTQYSFEEKEQDLSIYTRFLIEGIRSGQADRDEDGFISTDELHEYVSQKVREHQPAMKPEIYAVREGFKIRLSKTPQDVVRTYRQEVKKFIRRGEISLVGRSILNRVAARLGLDAAAAKAIEEEALAPYRQEFQAKLQEYGQVFAELLSRDKRITEDDRQDLQTLQQILELGGEDIEQIEVQVTARLLDSSSNVGLKLSELGGSDRSVAGSIPIQGKGEERSAEVKEVQGISVDSPRSQLSTFSFETVRVNEVGEIIDRQKKQAQYFAEDLGNGVTLEMVSIPGGKFMMGSPETEEGRKDWESPQHKVTVPAFFMGKYPVTQAQWKAIARLPKVDIDLKSDPSKFKGSDRPVETVSWRQAVEFCKRLSQKTGKEYRLPSEAEWEYGCRAGTTTPFHFGETITSDLANYRATEGYKGGPKGEYRGETTPVTHFGIANAFGLCEMHGNVWEWCLDHWHKNYEGAPTDGSAWLSEDKDSSFVLRGGSWDDIPRNCRSAFRSDLNPDVASYGIGFRVVCVVPRT